MGTIRSSEELKQEIAKLEAEVLIAKQALVEEGKNALENMSPLAPFKNIADKIRAYAQRENTLDTIIGLGTGLIVKKLVHKKPGGIIKNIAALLLQLTLTRKVSENKEAIQKLDREMLNGSKSVS